MLYIKLLIKALIEDLIDKRIFFINIFCHILFQILRLPIILLISHHSKCIRNISLSLTKLTITKISISWWQLTDILFRNHVICASCQLDWWIWYLRRMNVRETSYYLALSVLQGSDNVWWLTGYKTWAGACHEGLLWTYLRCLLTTISLHHLSFFDGYLTFHYSFFCY